MLTRVCFDAEKIRLAIGPIGENTIQVLMEWCGMHHFLPPLTDTDLLLFLFNRNFDMNYAKYNILHYFVARCRYSNYFLDRDPVNSEALRKIFDAVTILPLEPRTLDGHKVIFITLIDVDVELFNFTSFIKYLNMVLDICIYEEGVSQGFTFLIDLHRLSMDHLNNITQTSINNIIKYISLGFPCRWEKLHLVNTNETKNGIVQRFMEIYTSQFTKKVVELHRNWESVCKVIPLDILPQEIGPQDIPKSGRVMGLHKRQIKKLESHLYTFMTMDQSFNTIRNKLIDIQLANNMTNEQFDRALISHVYNNTTFQVPM